MRKTDNSTSIKNQISHAYIYSKMINAYGRIRAVQLIEFMMIMIIMIAPNNLKTNIIIQTIMLTHSILQVGLD